MNYLSEGSLSQVKDKVARIKAMEMWNFSLRAFIT